MTPDEIISSIKKSTIPTVCVEGVQDRALLRMIENFIGVEGSFIMCNGRTNLFHVWERRSEFVGKKVAFLADKDLYVFSSIPEEYTGITFTNGYSLENDTLITKRWEYLFNSEDSEIFSESLGVSLNYYWNQCKKNINEGASPVWISSFRLLKEMRDGTFVLEDGYETCALFKKISRNPYVYLRGKNLLDCVHIALSHQKRAVKYNSAQIIEMSIKPMQGKYISRIVNELSKKLK